MLTLVLLPALWAAPAGASAHCSPKGVLWEIRGAAGPPSYLLGTMHSDDPRLLELPDPLVSALRDARSFTMEVVIDPSALARLSQRMTLPADESLQRMLDAGDWRRLVGAMQRRRVPEPALRRMQPWAVAMALSMPEQFSGLALDLYLQQYAQRLGKPVHGLESIDEQVAIFDGLSRAEQLALLRTTLVQLPQLPRLIEALTEAYLSRDLAAMQALTEAQVAIGDARFNQRFMQRLVDQRNLRMLRRMQPRLREGGTFVAVGALHLPGTQGLLCLLREQGYRLKRVY